MVEATAGFPFPRLSRSRFSYAREGADDGLLHAYTDEALFAACGVRIAFTERGGGFGSGPYDSLNLAAHVDDDPGTVERNRAALLSALDVADITLIVPHQVHGRTIVEVADSRPQTVRAACEAAADGADAIVVDALADGIGALLCYADCMPVIIVAPNGTFAVAHAGWRGVVAHIACAALERVAEAAAVDAGACNVYIGPYIHGECFEVGIDVHDRFVDLFGAACALDDRHIDMGAAMRTDLLAHGASAERIADVGMCTVCGNERFFSYRAAHGICGRHGAFAVRAAASGS